MGMGLMEGNCNTSKKVYVGYGIGCNYDSMSEQIKKKIKLSYLCDQKFASDVLYYDDIPIILLNEIAKLKNVVVVIFPIDYLVKMEIANQLKNMEIEYVFVEDVLGIRRLDGKIIKEEGNDGKWEDEFNNVIIFHESLADNINIFIYGVNNVIIINKDVRINNLVIHMGNNGRCVIGANTRIVEADVFVSYASVLIGEECLFSTNIIIRTHDGHHIFDRKTHKRINVAKDVILQNHVWICEGVRLLPGAEIGEGSIVGAGAITSSQFTDHVLLAGVPAKVIREDICWSKDSTELINYSMLEECASKDALKYC